MITFEVHPEIHVRELHDRPSFSTCSECHRSFHAKSEDQLSLSLSGHCFEAMQNHCKPVIGVHVRARSVAPRCNLQALVAPAFVPTVANL